MLSRSSASLTSRLTARPFVHNTPPSARLAQLSSHFNTITPSQLYLRITKTNMSTYQKLNTGAKIPAIGFGTWQDVGAQEDAVLEALKAGYRHIDTARVYGTEPAVGRAIKKSNVPREELFITTKLWNNSHAPSSVEPALDASLKDLGLDYVDLYLMHWPGAFKTSEKLFEKDSNGKMITEDIDFVDTYKAMEKLVKSGKAKAIGISNFSKAETERILKECEVVPAAHQLECHPWLQQKEFLKWHAEKGIHVSQYSPFGNSNEVYDKGKHLGKLIEEPVLAEIGKKYGKTGAQVALAWGVNHGRSVLPKSKTPARIKANLEGDFKLDKEDLEKIDAMDKKMRFNDPSESFGYNCYTDLEGKN